MRYEMRFFYSIFGCFFYKLGQKEGINQGMRPGTTLIPKKNWKFRIRKGFLGESEKTSHQKKMGSDGSVTDSDTHGLRCASCFRSINGAGGCDILNVPYGTWENFLSYIPQTHRKMIEPGRRAESFMELLPLGLPNFTSFLTVEPFTAF